MPDGMRKKAARKRSAREGLAVTGMCDCGRKVEFMLYPHFAAYNATSADRPRVGICGHCAAQAVSDKRAERVGPFAFVRVSA